MRTMPKALAVGSRVRFRLGVRHVIGTIVEDLGEIGVGGRRLVRVEVPINSSYVRQFDVPTEILTGLRKTARPRGSRRIDTLHGI